MRGAMRVLVVLSTVPTCPSAGSTVIDGAGHTHDFDSQTSAGYYSVWRNGLNLDTDPSGYAGSSAETAGLPDFLGDSNFHSLISGHANKGITFDLDAVRAATGMDPELFTAYIGDSRNKAGGSISYFVFLDGELMANRNNITDSQDFVSIAIQNDDRYLSLVISDADNGIGSDHGYIGDAFLQMVPEPSTVAMLVGLAGMGLIGALRRWRR